MDSDTNLVKRINKGDTAALTELLKRHYDLIYRVAFNTLNNQQDAEDAAQDVCIALTHKLEKFKGKSKFTTWLYTITINHCRDFIRKSSTSQRTKADYTEVYTFQL